MHTGGDVFGETSTRSSPDSSATESASSKERTPLFSPAASITITSVDKKAVKKDFDDREDQDIDNDGDVDSSDKYLHKRRKAISKAIGKKKETLSEVEDEDDEDELGVIATPIASSANLGSPLQPYFLKMNYSGVMPLNKIL